MHGERTGRAFRCLRCKSQAHYELRDYPVTPTQFAKVRCQVCKCKDGPHWDADGVIRAERAAHAASHATAA